MAFIDEVLLRADEEKWRAAVTPTIAPVAAVEAYTVVVAALPSGKTELTKWEKNYGKISKEKRSRSHAS